MHQIFFIKGPSRRAAACESRRAGFFWGGPAAACCASERLRGPRHPCHACCSLCQLPSQPAPPDRGAQGGKRGRLGARPIDDAGEDEEDKEDGGPGSRLTFLSSSEVYAIMERVWQNNCPILSGLFAGGGRVAPQNGKASGLEMPLRPDGWRMFFLRIVPVAPNMFRRPSRMREQLYEHAQNVVLTRIINTNLDLLSAFTRPLPETFGGACTRVWARSLASF